MNAVESINMAQPGFLDEVWKFFMATRAELLLFCAAVAAYVLLFGNMAPKGKRPRSPKAKHLKAGNFPSEEEDLDTEHLEADKDQSLRPEERNELESSLTDAFQNGDHRQVLRCWMGLKRSEFAPEVPLAKCVESMQRFKKDNNFVLRELKAFFKRYPSECTPRTLNDILEPLARRLDSQLVDGVLAIASGLGVRPDERGYEALLSLSFTTRNFAQVRTLLEEMKGRGMSLTTRARIVAVKAALKVGSFAEAAQHFKELKSMWSGLSSTETPSNAPQHIVSQLVDLACRERQLAEFLPLLEGTPIAEDAIWAMLSECAKRKDPALSQSVERLVRGQPGQALSEGTYALLARCAAGDSARLQTLFDEVAAKGAPLSADFAMALLSSCAKARCTKLADQLLERMQPKQLQVLSAFIRFYVEEEQFEKACMVYEQHVLKPAGSDSPTKQPMVLDSRIERCLMSAALRCGRHDLAKNFLDASPSDVAKHIAMIRSCASSGNLAGAREVFETLRKSGVEMNSVIYNTVLDACVECRDLRAAEAWMEETKKEGFADVVSYNTLIKAHLQGDNFKKARSLMEEMRAAGLQPNRVTFNELVNGLVARGSSAAHRAEIWSIVREMKAAGVKPNQVTCSILLKSLNAWSKEAEIVETMDLITDMEDPMDEVLLSSVVEACVRIGKPDLLAEKLKQFRSTEGLAVNGSHTFGSLIKAYGHAKDINGVWRCWTEMRSRHIRPTSITLGCMVEAVVSNGDTEGAYDLIHQIREDEGCRDALNAVIFCSVLKGFTREKKIQRVWTVYEEMLSLEVELSVVTYNTLLDACARCGRMDRAPGIVEDMQAKGITPNLITYSTMVKGHCQGGDLDRGFAVLEEMRSKTRLQPDEIMYNSLLDGCAQNNLVDKGLALLEQMQREGVQPSNFTLSLLVKLMNRARKLDGAFAIVEEISQKFHFRPNVHVYTNLIQACVANRNLQRGVTTFKKMLKERIRPENRTYAILVRASLAQSQPEQAAALLRAAIGAPGAEPFVPQELQQTASTNNLDAALVAEALQGLTDRGHVHDLAVPLMSDIKHYRPQLRVDATTQRRVMSAGMAGPGAAPAASPAERGPQRGYGNGQRRDAGPRRGGERGGGRPWNA